jgi:inner membrane protein
MVAEPTANANYFLSCINEGLHSFSLDPYSIRLRMDVISHALAGAATALCAAKPHETRVAALAGAIAGIAPDADALIRSSDDALMYLEYHRHFTHSLLFVPIGAALVAGIVWLLLRRQFKDIGLSRLYLYCVLGFLLAGALDACTSYGTHLLWPFTEARTAWNVISVFDPLFTLLIAIPLVLAMRWRRPQLAALSLAVGASYLLLGALQHQRALSLLTAHANDQNLTAERLLVKPTFANLILWRGMIQTGDEIYVAVVRPSLLSQARVYPGERAQRAVVTDFTQLAADTRLHRDIERFAFFSDDLLIYADASATNLGDARYAMLPTSLHPMWSIRFDVTQPERPVELITDRTMTPNDRARFMDMLFGRP